MGEITRERALEREQEPKWRCVVFRYVVREAMTSKEGKEKGKPQRVQRQHGG